MFGNCGGTRTIQPEILALFRADGNEAFGSAQVTHAHHIGGSLHDGLLVVADQITNQHHLRATMALGLGGITHGLEVALVQMLQTGQQDAEVATAAIGFEVVGNFDNGRHGFADLAEELQTNGARVRRHFVQHPAGGDDDAVGAFFLNARYTTEELVGHVLAQPDLAAGGARHRQNFFAEVFFAGGIKTGEAETHGFLLVNLAHVVVESFDFEPVAIRRDHLPPGQVVERGAPQHGFLAAGVHGDVAANARGFSRRWVDSKDEARAFSRFGHALGHDAGAGAHSADWVIQARQVHELDGCDVDEFFGINHHRVGGEWHGTTGITRAASTWNDGEAELDAITHQRADFCFGIRVEHHEGILNAPVGGIGDVRYTGQAIKGDVVFTGVLGQRAQHFAAAGGAGVQVFGKAGDGFASGLEQLRDFLVAVAALFNFGQAVTQR